jgi:hypothetical protein
MVVSFNPKTSYGSGVHLNQKLPSGVGGVWGVVAHIPASNKKLHQKIIGNIGFYIVKCSILMFKIARSAKRPFFFAHSIQNRSFFQKKSRFWRRRKKSGEKKNLTDI